ncbi:MAG: Wzz/FepE/Etk N-terminal domain-containing protein [Candidatus Aminicenantaceae bacterium]
MEEYEVELMDYISVFKKKKWLIVIPTFIIVVAVGIYSFVAPKVWEIDAVIEMSKIVYQTKEAEFVEYSFDSPTQVANQINQGSYHEVLAKELSIDKKSLPKIKAENLRDTKLVKISVRDRDVERGKLILNTLFNRLADDLDVKPKKEKSAFEKNLVTIKKRIEDLEREMTDTKKRVVLLEDEQRLNLRRKDRGEGEILGNLLYSNEIVLSLKYYDELNEKLKKAKIEEIQEEKKIKGIYFTSQLKVPTPSLSPVLPRKKFNVLMSFLVSIFIFTMLALFLEYLEKQKPKSKA